MVSSIGQVIHNSKTTNSTNSNNSTKNKTLVTSTKSNSLIEDKYEKDFSSLIDPELVPQNWIERHYKVIHKIGPGGYMELIRKAKKYGRNPQALLCTMVSKELARYA